jgi:hypothetical protein
MKRLSSALWNLVKANAARPAKPIKPIPTKIHWTKAEKPLGEMTTDERTKFAEKLANKSLKALSPNEPIYTKQNHFNNAKLIWALIVLIFCLLIFNWEKVPRYGDNAKALNYVKSACFDKGLKIEERRTMVEKALSLDSKWLRLATELNEILSSNDAIKLLVNLGLEDTQEYRNEFNNFTSSLSTFNSICNGSK